MATSKHKTNQSIIMKTSDLKLLMKVSQSDGAFQILLQILNTLFILPVEYLRCFFQCNGEYFWCEIRFFSQLNICWCERTIFFNAESKKQSVKEMKLIYRSCAMVLVRLCWLLISRTKSLELVRTILQYAQSVWVDSTRLLEEELVQQLH